jgi:hypothetical protein
LQPKGSIHRLKQDTHKRDVEVKVILPYKGKVKLRREEIKFLLLQANNNLMQVSKPLEVKCLPQVKARSLNMVNKCM